MKKKDLRIGQKYGRLTILEFLPNYKCLVQCDCGTIKTVRIYNLRPKGTLSCGCLQKEKIGAVNRTHGRAKTKVYSTWERILNRCRNKNYHSYKYYGGRGIKVCQRWLNSFENFLEDMGEPPTSEHSIDRIDYNEDYSPENCHWLLQKYQARNTSRNRYVTWNGETRCISEWAEIQGINRRTITVRLDHGWSITDALSRPVQEEYRHSYSNSAMPKSSSNSKETSASTRIL
jgi:hypothetical protein